MSESVILSFSSVVRESRSGRTSRSVFSAPSRTSTKERWKEGLGDWRLPDNALITDFTDERTNEIPGRSSSRPSVDDDDIERTEVNKHAKRKMGD